MTNILNCESGKVIVVKQLPTEADAKAGKDRFCVQEVLIKGRELVARWMNDSRHSDFEVIAVITHGDKIINGQTYTEAKEIYVTKEGLETLKALNMGHNLFINVSPNCGIKTV